MPSFASITLPKNDATGVDINTVLSWSATDEDGDTLYYNVYFDNKADPELVSEKQVSQTYKPQTLEYDTKYYWRVEVSDGRKVNPRSDLWSFTTAKAPVVMPKIASIETPESETDYLSIKFNKHIDSSKMSKAVKFVPELSGTWTWTDDNKIARFIPESGSWWPGSYNVFTLTANILSDAEGNLMTEERSESFTIPSSVAVPAGYRSYGFPIQVPRNTTFSVSVPNLAYGKNSYILAIADADKTSGTVSSMRASLKNIERIKEKDPTHALRLREAEMIHIPISTPKRSSIDASFRASTLGETRDFYIDEIAESGDSITATLMALSGNTKIYVDNSIIDSNKNTKAQEFLSVFESKVLQKVRDAFGNEPEIGVDGDSRISIVLFDCKNDGLAGYFTNVDLYSKSVFAKSNECKAFYVSYSTELFTAFATLAHEFQHMINYYQKNKNPSSPQILEEVWVNEGLSELAQQVCGYSLLDGDYNTTALTKLSMENNKNLSLTYWGDDTVNCYGQVFLFMRFLAQPGRYNSDSIQISRALVNADDGKKLGEKNIENVTGEPFKETMAKWALSCFINNYGDNSPSAYGIYGINLKGRYNSVQLPGYEIENISGSISLSNMRKNSMRCFKKASTGSGNTTITISTGNQPITLWCFDERN